MICPHEKPHEIGNYKREYVPVQQEMSKVVRLDRLDLLVYIDRLFLGLFPIHHASILIFTAHPDLSTISVVQTDQQFYLKYTTIF